jgi:hypothetical protein
MFYKCKNQNCDWDGLYHEALFDGMVLNCPMCYSMVFNYDEFCTAWYLRRHPNDIFVFGDNTVRRGKGGAAKLRYEPNTYGFITKKRPDHRPSSYYNPAEYRSVFNSELEKLENFVIRNIDKRFLVSKIGAGIANKHNIWEVVKIPLESFIRTHENVIQLWQD